MIMGFSSDTSEEQIRLPPAPPSSFNATAESILADTITLIGRGKAAQDAIVACMVPESATFTNTILPLVHEENEILYERQLIEFYASVSPDEEIRKASRKAEQLFSEFDTQTAMRNDLYTLMAAVRDKGEVLHPESYRILDKLLLDFKQNGLALPEEKRDCLRRLNRDLEQVRDEYMDAISASKGSEIWLTEDELEGVSDRIISELERGTDSHRGKLCLRLEGMMKLNGLMSTAKRSETRYKIYSNFANSYKANVALLAKSAELRAEKARLLGYPSYAEFKMANKMEKSPSNIEAFLDDLLLRLTPIRDDFVAKWRQMKRDDLKTRGEPDDGKFYPWDRSYYSQLMLEREFDLEGNIVSEFFTLDETVRRMLEMFERLLGLSFVAFGNDAHNGISQDTGNDALIWHEDVQIFAVWDNIDSRGECANFLGYLYMDMFTRPGKRPGFADLPIRPAYTDANGSRTYTSTGLVCNFGKPPKDKPCLLRHSQVVLLFHELGHGIHDLVAKTEYARFHGASTAGDFNEAPSQMLENWCWLPSTLRMLSQHYSSLSPENFQIWKSEATTSIEDGAEGPEALPEDLIEKLIRSKKAENVLRCLAILNMSFFDMAINRLESQDAAANVDTTRIFFYNTQRVFGIDLPDDLPPLQAADPNHFMVSGMYIYLTSQLYSSDMFQTVFEADPLNREEGLRYRRAVLGKGSSEDEMKMLTDFLGRPPKADALYRELGLV